MARESRTSKYHRHLALGLCGACNRKALPGLTMCQTCKEKRQAWWNKQVERKALKMQKSIEWAKSNPEKVKAQGQAYRDKKRAEVLAAYGGKCACCGEDGEPFLTIDHVNGNGAEHRRQLNNGKWRTVSSDIFYGWLRRNNYPEGFQVLCYNCNCAKRTEKVCPHQWGKENVGDTSHSLRA